MNRRRFLGSLAAAGVAGGAVSSQSWVHAVLPGRPWGEGRPLRVQVLMFDGVEEQDWAGPFEVLGLAASLGAPLECRLITAGRPGRVASAYGAQLDVDLGWSPAQVDLLVVPGSRYADPKQPGVHQLIGDPAVMRNLRDVHDQGVVMAGVCTGVMVLSGAGLTRGRPCTTHHGAKEDLAAQGGSVVDARVVDDGDLVTAGGITSGLDLGLWLIEREFGTRLAAEAESALEYERRGTVWRG
ncbi:AraC family transcriptional regulator [Amycolatopsis sp. A1MSW2902]|uniref:DJ-1/PfpI family protein n=1 Tax=Amycolatopsis sp. A1MSW2902 TaxID=687413 RepID=UPI00307EB63D